MNGKHTVRINDNRVRYSFELVRNITIVKGNSGTGKTTLYDMVSAYTRLKDRSGVQIACDKPCVALHAESDWQARLGNIHESIVFIDEDAEYIATHAFASAIRHTDNYYVIFCYFVKCFDAWVSDVADEPNCAARPFRIFNKFL